VLICNNFSFLVVGPLLYHFSDMPSEFSIELSWEDIRRIAVEEIGFEIVVRMRNNGFVCLFPIIFHACET